MDTSHVDLLALIQHDVPLMRVASTNGGEFAGPCPFCAEGDDRFRVWPTPAKGAPRYWCRRCERSGDAIRYLMDHDGRTFRDACRLLGLSAQHSTPLSRRFVPMQRQRPTHTERTDWPALSDPGWQPAAQAFLDRSRAHITGPQGAEGREYCNSRGLSDAIINTFQLGFNPKHHDESWGTRRVELPKGIVIPWFGLNRDIWKVNIRRRDDHPKKYKAAGGSANGLFNVSAIRYGVPVIMVEGEFCAMSLRAIASDLVVPVATGSVTGSRLARWIGCVAIASKVLLAFDADDPGDEAAAAWQQWFPQAVRLRPTRHDVNEMLTTGDDITEWLAPAL